MPIIKVEITSIEDGERVIRTLEGQDAIRWQEMGDEVEHHAQARGVNPDWNSLAWTERRERVEAENH